MAKRLAKLQSEDATLNRVQDQLLGVLNPILRTLPDGIGDKPTVSGSTAGNAALQSLLAALASMNLIVDITT